MNGLNKTSRKFIEQLHRPKLSPSRFYRLTIPLHRVILLFLLVCLLSPDTVSADNTKRVLVINSYHPTYVWTKEMIKGIETTLADYDPSIELDIEYMDTKRISDEKHHENLYNLYKHKNIYYDAAGKHYNVIIACDDAAFLFILKYRDQFSDNPVVFCGVNISYEKIKSLLKNHHSITGIIETYNYESTLQTALKFHPSVKQVVVIHNEKSSSYNQYKMELRDATMKLSDRVKFVDFSIWGISKGKPLKTLESLSDESIVLLLSGLMEPTGNLYPLPEGIVTLQERCTAPIYATSREWIELGLVVGGDVTSSFHHGREAAKMALRILEGQKPDDIPIMRRGPNIFMFNYERLKQFGIPPSNLPKNSIILNKPQSFYYRYKTQIHIVTAIIATLTAVVIILLVSILRCRRIERKVRHLAMIVEQAGEGIALSDLDGMLQYVNTAWARMHGYETAKNLVGKHLRIFHTDEQMKTDVIPFSEQTMRAGYNTGEVQHARKDGTTFPTEMITTIFKDEKGKPAGFIGFAIDVTERKHAEQQLQKAHDELELRVRQRTAELAEANQQLKSEIIERKQAEENLAKERNLLRTLIDNIPDYVYIKDAESRFILNNKAHQHYLGVTSQDELTGKTDLDVFPKQLATAYYADEREIIKSGKALINREEMGKDAEGKEQWLLATKIPLRDSSGKITTLVGVSRDITEQKQITDALQKNREQLTATLESTADGILTVDEKQNILHFNTQFTKMWRIPQNIIETKNDKKMLDYVSDQLTEPQTFLSKVYQLYASYEDSFDTLFFKDGRVFERFSRPLIQDGQLIGRVWSFRNVTKRKQAEQKILEYQKDLQSLASELSLAEEKLRHQMAIEIHDNIGQNLAISKIKIESLARSLKSSEFAGTVEEILELLSGAIENSRSLSFELSPPVLYELGFEAGIDWLVRRTKQRDGLDAEFENDGNSKPLKDNVRTILFQAVRELLVNVVKHARAKKVKVSIQKIDSEINVTVEDNGVGFDASGIRERNYSGQGFGLFSIQERLGYIEGRVDIKSAKGRGTRITLTAPLHKKNC